MNNSFRTFLNRGIALNIGVSLGIVLVLVGAASRFTLQASQSSALLVACALVALIIGLIHQSIKRGRMLAPNMLHYLVPEWFSIIVIMRIAAIVDHSLSFNELLALWLRNPLSVFDFRFVMYLIVALIVVVITHAQLSDLRALEPYTLSKEDYRDQNAHQFAVIMSEEQTAAFTRISSRLITGVALLLVLVALEQVELPMFSLFTATSKSGIGLVLYLVCALLFFSQARLALMQATWALENVTINPNISSKWLLLSVGLTILIMALAWLLPRSYGGPLFDAVAWLFSWVSSGLLFVGGVLFWLVSWLIAVPFSLLPNASGSDLPPLGDPALPAAPPSQIPDTVSSPSILPALIFWLCMALLAGYAIWLVFQRYPGLRKIFSWGPFVWLATRWKQASQTTRAWIDFAQERFADRFGNETPAQQAKLRLHLRSLTPRNLLRYFYYSVLRRAEESGVPRQPAQTPSEYVQSFQEAQTELAPEFTQLSEAFIKAQYSNTSINKQDVKEIEGLWKKIIRALQRNKMIN